MRLQSRSDLEGWFPHQPHSPRAVVRRLRFEALEVGDRSTGRYEQILEAQLDLANQTVIDRVENLDDDMLVDGRILIRSEL